MTPDELERRKATNKTIFKIFGLVLLVLVVGFVGLGLWGNSMETEKAAKIASAPAEAILATVSLPGTPLRAVRMDQQFSKATSGKRAVLTVKVYPLDDQSQAKQADLAATAMREALDTHARLATPIIDVWVMAQDMPEVSTLSADARGVGNLALARAVYIADGMGGDGKTASAVWTAGDLYEKDNAVAAAVRGFTEAELEYLRLYRSLHDQYATNGVLGPEGETRINAAIAQKMGIEPGSLKPFLNIRQPVAVR